MFGVPDGFVTIDLCVTSAADYVLKSQVLAGLPGNYILYSIKRRSEQIMHWRWAARSFERRKENGRNLMASQDGSGRAADASITPQTSCSDMWVVFPDGLTATHFWVCLIAQLHSVYTDIHPTKKCYSSSAYRAWRVSLDLITSGNIPNRKIGCH